MVGNAFSQQPEGRRKALVIGNADYPEPASLAPTTINDARAVYGALLKVGFNPLDIDVEYNRTRDEIITDLATFSRKLQPEDKAFFYFSGHGFSIGAENYIVPIRFAVGSTQTETANAAISVSSIINRMLSAKVQVVVLDACRDEPDVIRALPKSIPSSTPPKNMVKQITEGTLIAFAAGSGKQADAKPVDGQSIFTHYFVINLLEKFGDLQDAIDKTRASVYEASGHNQNPAVYNDLQFDFPLGTEKPQAVISTTLDAQTITDALRRNVSRQQVNRKFIYKFHVWQIWLALPPELANQVEKVTYTYPEGYLKGATTRFGDMNRPLGLTSWFANSCGEGDMRVDVQLKDSPNHVIANFDLCKVPESGDIPPEVG